MAKTNKSDPESTQGDGPTTALSTETPQEDPPQTPPESPAEAGQAAPEKEPEDGKLTPKQWAKKLGKVGKAPSLKINGKPRPAPMSWDHAVADQIHGWTEHGQHTVEELRLSRDEYEAAIKAAHSPDSKGNYVAHLPAKSPFKRGTR